MQNEDMVVVLSNLLDNAIEAVGQCEDNRVIKIKFIQEKDGFVLSVHNTIKDKIEIINNEIVTTKKDKLNHGYGIKNVKAVLEKYGYSYSISCNDGWFKFTILLQS